MNAMMTIEADEKTSLSLDIPSGQTFEEWVAMGRALAASERVLGWYKGDWWEAKKPAWGLQADQAAENIWGHSYSTLRQYGAVSKRFESDRRLSDLTFEHHREVAPLPDAEVARLLARAVTDNMSTRDLRIEAMKRKVALGLFKPRDQVDDDPEYTALKAIAAAWNRAPVGARETFADMIEEASLGVIEV